MEQLELTHHFWEHKLIKSLALSTTADLCGPTIPIPDMYPKELYTYVHQKTHTYVHDSTVYTGSKLKTTQCYPPLGWINSGILARLNTTKQQK